MKKLVIIFGGSFGLYQGRFDIFREIDLKFNCKTRRVGVNKLVTKIKDVDIEIYLCLNPIRDKNYLKLKKGKEESGWKEIVPPPANELVKKIKNCDAILFFGFCGGFQGSKGEIYLPEKFSEVFFKNYIRHEEILKIKTYNPVKIKNIFKNKIKSKYKNLVTSNLTSMPKAIENNSKEKLIELIKILSKYGDGVDKESYQIAKHFKKSKIGFALMSSDVVNHNKKMLKEGIFKPNKEKFNKIVFKGIKIGLEELKKK